MATNDLMSELQKDSIKLDDDSERKVSHIFITNMHNVLVCCRKCTLGAGLELPLGTTEVFTKVMILSAVGICLMECNCFRQ